MEGYRDYIAGLCPEAPQWVCEQLAEELQQRDKRIVELKEERDIFKRTLDKRDAELKFENRKNAICPSCKQPHFTLLLDKRCQLCVYKERISKLETAITKHLLKLLLSEGTSIEHIRPSDRQLWQALQEEKDEHG